MNAEFHTLKHYEEKPLKQATTFKFHITNRLPNLEERTSLIMYTIPPHSQGLYMHLQKKDVRAYLEKLEAQKASEGKVHLTGLSSQSCFL